MSVKGKYAGGRSAGLTREEMKRRHKSGDSDGYLFDVEYEKLKQEREQVEREYEHAREEYMRISEELRREMANGTASDADMTRFMAVLTNKGVQLQQEQAQLQKSVDQLAEQRAGVEDKMNELRMRAFGGNTRAYASADKETKFNGFKVDKTSRYANARVVEMSPQEYLRRVAFDIKGNGLDELLQSASPSQVEKYMRQMLRGSKISAPGLNYRNRTSTGDTRALAAMFSGFKRIPVMLIEE